MRLPVGVIHGDERLFMIVVVSVRMPYDNDPTVFVDGDIVHPEVRGATYRRMALSTIEAKLPVQRTVSVVAAKFNLIVRARCNNKLVFVGRTNLVSRITVQEDPS